jgi:hypothetical protein
MKGLAEGTAKKVDAMLAEEEAALLSKSSANLAALKPKLSDKAAFDILVAAVEESTRRNESVAALQARISKLGDAVVTVAKSAAKLL